MKRCVVPPGLRDPGVSLQSDSPILNRTVRARSRCVSGYLVFEIAVLKPSAISPRAREPLQETGSYDGGDGISKRTRVGAGTLR